MLGLLLAGFATVVEEIRDSIGKYEISHHRLTIYAFGFLTSLGGLLTILAVGFFVPKDFFAPGFPGGFVFAAASIPTLLVRLALEPLQAYVTLRAIVEADRSTFGFLRTLTLPLLFAVDVFLGYSLGTLQVVGLVAIIGSLLILFLNHGLTKNGSLLTLIGAVNAVATISLYKYNVTYYNSVEMEQALALALLTVLLLGAAIVTRQNPLHLLARPRSVLHVIFSGFAQTAFSFAFLFAPASLITAAKRSLSVLWALLSGHVYFEERHAVLKLVCFLLVSLGIMFLVI